MSAAEEPTARAGDVLLKATEYLKERGRESPRLGAEILLANALGCDRLGVYLRFEQPLSTEQLDRYRELVRRRGRGEPVAYLIGEKEFHSLRFRVTPAVLIPRPETETLVEVAVEEIRRRSLSGPRVLDLGTGSGNVLIAVAREIGGGSYVGVDHSAEALAVARENAEVLSPGADVRFHEGDWFQGAATGEGGFDAILSNPPYIRSGDIDRLPAEISVHEPRLALDGGEDGLKAYRVIAGRGGALLNPGGFIAVEVGDGQSEAVAAVFAGFGYATAGRRDPGGRERVVLAEKGG